MGWGQNVRLATNLPILLPHPGSPHFTLMQRNLPLFCSAALVSLSSLAQAQTTPAPVAPTEAIATEAPVLLAQNPAANTPSADLPTGTPSGAAPPPGQPTGGTPATATRPVAPPQPFYTIGGFGLSGYLRIRPENYDWFSVPNRDNEYTFTGYQLRLAGVRSTPKLDVQIDLQGTALSNLPENAIGIGATYRLANNTQDGAISLKQAFVRFKGAVGPGSAARLGRFEFSEGLELVNADPTLTFLKTQRIAQRLVGTFAFTNTGRSFDGINLSARVGKDANFTGVLARPTEGVFKLDSNDNVDATQFLYGAYSKPFAGGEGRVFGLIYEDGREAPKSVKTDNRPLPRRQADDDKIRTFTLGANAIKTLDTGGGKVDLLAWGALQGGDWGTLDHSANAFALEAGYQPKNVKLKPWFRLGYYRATGDDDPLDGDHGTFHTPLPTPRILARYPFYNLMNNTSIYAQLILRPNPNLQIRSEFQNLNLTNRNDLLYAGGGPFNDEGFGIGGTPSRGQKRIGNLIDTSIDYKFNNQSSVGFYIGQVIDSEVFADSSSRFAFLEFTQKF